MLNNYLWGNHDQRYVTMRILSLEMHETRHEELIEIFENQTIDFKLEFAIDNFEIQIQEMVEEELYISNIKEPVWDYIYDNVKTVWRLIEESHLYDEILVEYMRQSNG